MKARPLITLLDSPQGRRFAACHARQVRVVLAAALGAVALVVAATQVTALQQGTGAARWTTAWATSQHSLGTTHISNATVRMIARVTIGGDAVRIRLDNTFGTTPLHVANASVGLRTQGPALAQGSNRPVRFNGAASVTIDAGGTAISDPVSMRTLPQQDLAVSLHVPEADVRPSQHDAAMVTSYLTPDNAGDHTTDEAAKAFSVTTTATFWLKAIDVSGASASGAVVVFGDSITDGNCTTLDAHDRWEDVVAVRLATSGPAASAQKAIVNEGIAGNTITRESLQPPADSPPGLERLDRDVLSHQNVTHVVLFMGTNDIRRNAPAAQVIAGMQKVIERVKARRLKMIGVTIIPRHNRPPAENNTGWSAEKTAIRNEVNQWIRTKAPFDAVIDFDAIVRDPRDANLIQAPFNCDGTHPSPMGYFEMGRSVRLDLFK